MHSIKEQLRLKYCGYWMRRSLRIFVYNMYEIYHTEAIENAYMDIDSLIATGKTAW